ncbi:hypothetical protein [Agromyces lapidis]|uniref:Histidine kinase n=1 Tax=Agromyces lapidis TaxID=279574 RepID=A0ABV5SNW0_9MICO|nr:hypothetical protein [Agromyces lapidis]
MPSIDVIAGLAFIATFIAVSVATADTAGLEQRLRRRGSVAESAQAMRHAQDVMDFARGGYLGVVCTPSRRSLHLSGDLDADAVPSVAPSPAAEAVAAVPLRPAPSARHLAPRRRLVHRRLARGIRTLFGPTGPATSTRAPTVTAPAARRASATTRPPGDTR